MNGPEQRPLLAQPPGLSARTVRWLRVLLLAAVAAVFGLLYLLSAEFRSETNRALGILGRGDIAGLRDYIVSFGLWRLWPRVFLWCCRHWLRPYLPSSSPSQTGSLSGCSGAGCSPFSGTCSRRPCALGSHAPSAGYPLKCSSGRQDSNRPTAGSRGGESTPYSPDGSYLVSPSTRSLLLRGSPGCGSGAS